MNTRWVAITLVLGLTAACTGQATSSAPTMAQARSAPRCVTVARSKVPETWRSAAGADPAGVFRRCDAAHPFKGYYYDAPAQLEADGVCRLVSLHMTSVIFSAQTMFWAWPVKGLCPRADSGVSLPVQQPYVEAPFLNQHIAGRAVPTADDFVELMRLADRALAARDSSDPVFGGAPGVQDWIARRDGRTVWQLGVDEPMTYSSSTHYHLILGACQTDVSLDIVKGASGAMRVVGVDSTASPGGRCRSD
ncbi:MAG: hypothetical protein JWM33_1865 [Caulobacteraceae bacterium]|nr:hypothetical protein [Caulobacteraceae bacterium]